MLVTFFLEEYRYPCILKAKVQPDLTIGGGINIKGICQGDGFGYLLITRLKRRRERVRH